MMKCSMKLFVLSVVRVCMSSLPLSIFSMAIGNPRRHSLLTVGAAIVVDSLHDQFRLSDKARTRTIALPITWNDVDLFTRRSYLGS